MVKLGDPHDTQRYPINNLITPRKLGVGATDRFAVDVHNATNGVIYFYGWVVYEDAFKQPRTTYFARYFNGGQNRFFPIPDPDYNSED